MMIFRLVERPLLTKYGTFQEILYYDGQHEAVALFLGDVYGAESVPCRIHSACLSAHVFNSIECDCREQMEMSQNFIQKEGRGIVVWLDQEGKGNGHLALMASKKLIREQGISQTEAYEALGFQADQRRYHRAGEILIDLGVRSVVLLTNNPLKITGVAGFGVPVTGTRRLLIDSQNNHLLSRAYRDKALAGHFIEQKYLVNV